MQIEKLTAIGIFVEEFMAIESEFRNTYPFYSPRYDAAAAYKDLERELFNSGETAFSSFIAKKLDETKQQLERYSNKSDVSYYCGIDVRIYQLIQLHINNLSRSLTDLLNQNQHISKLLTQYEAKVLTTSAYLAEADFQEQELKRIDDLYLKPTEFKVLNQNVLASFSVEEYQKFAYQWLMRGEDRKVIDILRTAKNNYLNSFTPPHLPADLSQSLLTALDKGAAYVKYAYFLREKIKNTAQHDGLEYQLRQAIDIALRWNPNSIRDNRSDKQPYSVLTYFCLNARLFYESFEKTFEQKLNRGMSEHLGIAIKDKYFLMIKQYQDWYEPLKSKLATDFGSNNPYIIIDQIAADVRRKILLHFPIEPATKPDLPNHFFVYTEHYTLIRDIMVELEITDSDGKCILTTRKGYLLFALIEGIKRSSKISLKKTYTYNELLDFFNTQIGSNFTRVKPDSKDFKRTTQEVQTLINKRLS